MTCVAAYQRAFARRTVGTFDQAPSFLVRFQNLSPASILGAEAPMADARASAAERPALSAMELQSRPWTFNFEVSCCGVSGMYHVSWTSAQDDYIVIDGKAFNKENFVQTCYVTSGAALPTGQHRSDDFIMLVNPATSRLARLRYFKLRGEGVTDKPVFRKEKRAWKGREGKRAAQPGNINDPSKKRKQRHARNRDGHGGGDGAV